MKLKKLIKRNNKTTPKTKSALTIDLECLNETIKEYQTTNQEMLSNLELLSSKIEVPTKEKIAKELANIK